MDINTFVFLMIMLVGGFAMILVIMKLFYED